MRQGVGRVIGLLGCVVVGSVNSEQIVIVNESSRDIQFSLNPKEGSWVSLAGLSPADRQHVLLWDTVWKDFLVQKRQSGRFVCFGCSAFRYNSTLVVGGLNEIPVGMTYTFTDGNPVFHIRIPGKAEPLTGLNISQFVPWEHFWLYREGVAERSAAGAASDEIPIAVKKAKGAWGAHGTDAEITGATRTIAAGRTFTGFGCGNCGTVEIVAVDGRSVHVVMIPGRVYSIDSDRDPPEVSETALSPPPGPPLAMGSASGGLYIVNGQQDTLKFSFVDSAGSPEDVSLLGLEGASFFCKGNCSVEMRTGKNTISRLVQPGKSYIIAFDTVAGRYDLRVYSE